MTIPCNISEPQANDILVYDELTGEFFNTPPTMSLFGTGYLTSAMNIGNAVPILNDVQDGKIRFKTIKGVDGVVITSAGSEVIVKFDGDARTLSGLNKDGFLQVDNALSDINVNNARNNLSVYSKIESNDIFMEINESNIPDIDNKYDLGSNGRRYANIFAVSFHGTATEAVYAQKLNRNGALDGEVLTWDTNENSWIPKSSSTNMLTYLLDVDDASKRNGSVLAFNAARNMWEAVPASFAGGGSGSSDLQFENTGNGNGVYSSTFSDVVKFKTLRGNNGISIIPNFDSTELIISSNHATTTDGLVEGVNNLYYTDDRVNALLNGLSLGDLADVDTGLVNKAFLYYNAGTVSWTSKTLAVSDIEGIVMTGIETGDGLVWNDDIEKFVPMKSPSKLIDMNETVESLHFNGDNLVILLGDVTTDDIGEGLVNKFFTDASFDLSFSEKSINDLVDVNIESIQDGEILAWNADRNMLVPMDIANINFDSNIRLRDLVDVVDSNPTNGFTIVYNSVTSLYEYKKFKTTLDDFDSVVISNLKSNQALVSSGAIFTNKNVAVLSGTFTDGSYPKYQNGVFVPSLSPSVNIRSIDGINIGTLQEGDVLVYDSITEKFVNTTINVAGAIVSLSDVTVTNLQTDDILVYDGTKFINKNMPIKTTMPVNGQVLIYDNTNSAYVNKDLLSEAGLSVELPIAGQMLVYDDTTQKFANRAIELKDLSNTENTEYASDGQVLTYNGVTGKYEPKDPSKETSVGGITERVATQGQTDFNIDHEGMVFVSVNGFVVSNADLDLSNYSIIKFNTPRNGGDVIKVMVLTNNKIAPTISAVFGTLDEFTASDSQTVFTIEHNGAVLVTANGLVVSGSDINITDTSSITFYEPRVMGDVVKVVVLGV